MINWIFGLLEYPGAHTELKTSNEQDFFADAEAIAFVRATSVAGCAPRELEEQLLIALNKAAQSETVQFEGDTLGIEEPATLLTIHLAQ